MISNDDIVRGPAKFDSILTGSRDTISDMKDNKLDKKDKIEKISLGRFMISADMAAASCLPQAAVTAAAAAHDSGDAAVMGADCRTAVLPSSFRTEWGRG